ncbi:M14 family metallopeptidase [Bacillus sp. FSL K6-3431]|uniref:M14 family metallopeptidase n=1 Tax=Bacillus sp. FSL K6-3431 TaxID=2921500 RepID=UPI0030F8D752
MDVRVRSGDTLWHYSQLFYIPLVLLIDSNPNIDPNALPLGEFVKIPGFLTNEYTIQNGDTYWKLARARNVDIDVLMLLNQDANPTHLKKGTIIRLPSRVTNIIVNGNQAYDFQKMSNDLKQLRSIYPFMKCDNIGKSVLQLPLHQVRIGKSSRKVNINASFHANEWITTPILMKFLNEYLLALTNGQTVKGISALTLYFRFQLFAVPIVNPDGVNLVLNGPPAPVREEVLTMNKGSSDFSGWKANIRGVDLNKQFPAKWELEKERKQKEPGPRDFSGYAPLSQPESQAMAALAEQIKFERLLALHTQGKEIYWGYEGHEPAESEILANDFSMVSGYKAVRYVDNFAGYKDWFIQQFHKPGFTLELGNGQNPLPIEQFDEIYEHVSGIFVRSLM